MYKVRATYLPHAGMHFDHAYYFREHVALAGRQTAGRVNIRRIEVESDERLLLDGGTLRAPLTFCAYLDSLADVEGFRRFLTADPAVEPLRDDVPNYTDCELVWSVCEVREF